MTIDLLAPARVLLVGRVGAESGGSGGGSCRLGTSVSGGLASTAVGVLPGGATALTAITPPLGPGSVSFGIDCNEIASPMAYQSPQISAVALAAN